MVATQNLTKGAWVYIAFCLLFGAGCMYAVAQFGLTLFIPKWRAGILSPPSATGDWALTAAFLMITVMALYAFLSVGRMLHWARIYPLSDPAPPPHRREMLIIAGITAALMFLSFPAAYYLHQSG